MDEPAGFEDERWYPWLRPGEPGGATEIGRITVRRRLPGNPRVLDVAVSDAAAGTTRRFVAFAMVGGPGGAGKVDPRGVLYRTDRPLRSPLHDPRLDKHSLLRLPQARVKGRRFDPDGSFLGQSVEVLAMDEWFARQPQKLWVLRLDGGSRPFRERFLLLPADEPSDRPVHSLYLFGGWDADRIAGELRGLTVPEDQLTWADGLPRD